METITVHGLVVRDVQIGEFDKLITLLTAEHGKVTVCGKGVKNLKSHHMPSCQPFSYSIFTLRKSKKYYYIAETTLLELFYHVRCSLEKLSLATYLCDIAADLCMEEVPDIDLLRLTLNAISAIDRCRFPLDQIKGAFEMRCASIAGFMPDLSACAICGKNKGEMYIDIMNGRLLCKNCRPTEEHRMEMEDEGTSRLFMILSDAALEAMRYVISCPLEKLVSFKIDSDDLYVFYSVCESYLLNHLERGFSTLEFYKSLT